MSTVITVPQTSLNVTVTYNGAEDQPAGADPARRVTQVRITYAYDFDKQTWRPRATYLYLELLLPGAFKAQPRMAHHRGETWLNDLIAELAPTSAVHID